MVIEVSKEIDVRRIGIDRYSLKTGLNLRTVMDMSFQVIKEPRGFIRIIQCIMAILAFATTVGFSTICEFKLICDDKTEHEVEYEVEYPFKGVEMVVPRCDGKEDVHLPFEYDFSNSAKFFVTTGVLCFLYTLLILAVYIFFHQTYAQNNRVPVVDLGISAVLTIFWLAGSSAWADGVSNVKFFVHPERFFPILHECIENDCDLIEDGSYGTLNASLVLGFANFLLWLSSLWFIYKETIFFSTPEPVPETNQNQQIKTPARV